MVSVVLSPSVSAYGASPITTMAYEKPFDLTKSLSGSSRNTTSVLGSTVDLMAARMVVPVDQEKEI